MAYEPFSRGQYSITPPVLSDQQTAPVALDVNANVQTNVVKSALPQGAAQDGTDASAAVAPAGGTGIRGWLSGIFTTLAVFLASSAGGYVRQDSTATIAKETGGNLAAVATALTTGPVPVSAATLPLPANAAQETGGNLAAAVAALLATLTVKQSSNPAGGPLPLTVTADATLKDILLLQLLYTRATYQVLAHLASEDGTMALNDFDPENLRDPNDDVTI